MAEEYGANELLSQKSHVTPNIDNFKFNIFGLNFAWQNQHNKYGLSIYMKSKILQLERKKITRRIGYHQALEMNGWTLWHEKSSREAWALLKRLDGKNKFKKAPTKINLQVTSEILIENSQGILSKDQNKSAEHKLWRNL